MSTKLTPKAKAVLDYVREHDTGDGVTMAEIAEGTGLTIKACGPLVWTSLKEKKDGSRPTLVTYEKRTVEGQEKPVGFVHITEEGKNWVDPVEEVAE
jgi:hypothetical protein